MLILVAVAGIVAFPFLWRSFVEWRYKPRIYTVDEVPDRRVAIVFGAAVYRGGRLSPMLRDRMETAVALYQAGKVQHLLVSGDNQTDDYNEPGRMMEYALARGVPAEAIQPDYAGRRTYDTCYRARDVFQVQSAILVTQAFHLPRALFTCDRLGLTTVGVSADRRNYHPRSLGWSRTRELAALLRALLDTTVQRPPPVLGEEILLY
jgi:SanA protein